MQQLVECKAAVRPYEIPLKSITRDPGTGEQCVDEGRLLFREIVLYVEGVYLATLLADAFQIQFQDKIAINIDPRLRSAFTSPSYALVRDWFKTAESKILTQLTTELPTVRRLDDTSEVDFEDEMEAFQLMSGAAEIGT